MRLKIKKLQDGGSLKQLIDRTNKKSVDFINRLKDPNRKYIKDWENPNNIATHKMSWATDDKGNAIVYPNVQNINGKLIDFTNPKYKKWDGYNSAVQRGDTIMTTSKLAEQYSNNGYKKFYPGFNKEDNIKPVQLSFLNYKPKEYKFSLFGFNKNNFNMYNIKRVLPILDELEGFKDHVYKDGNGIDTIGHGLTAKKYIQLGKISKEESLKGVEEHINKEVLPVLKKQPYWNNLNDNQKDALVSYVYNIGSGGFMLKSPSLQKALKDNNWEEAAKQIDFGYNDSKNPGLKDRRDFERSLFLNNPNYSLLKNKSQSQ